MVRWCGVLVLILLAACGGSGGGGPAVPTLMACVPDSDFEGGGALVAIRGSGFATGAAPEILFGDIPAGAVTVVDDGEIRCAVPPGPEGTVDVRARFDTGNAALANGFTWYRFPPVVTAGGVRLNTNGIRSGDDGQLRMARDGEHLYAVWESDRHGAYDVWMNASADGGATWWSADQRVDAGPAGTLPSIFPDVCASGDTGYVVWVDEPAGAVPEVWFSARVGGGTSIAERLRLDPGLTIADINAVRVACEGDSVYVVWADERVFRADLYFRASHDRGATWEPEVRLDPGDAGDMASSDPQIAVAGDRVYVLWLDEGHPHLRASPDRGTTWPAGGAVDTAMPAAHRAVGPRLDCDGLHVYVVWQGWLSAVDRPDIFAQASHDGGGSWLPAVRRLDADAAGAADSFLPVVTCAGLRAYVAWTDARRGANDVYFRASQDGGLSWGASDQMLNAPHAGADASESPDLACAGEVVHVAWRDDLAGGVETRLRSSVSGGATWNPSPLRLDAPVFPTLYHRRPCVLADGARVFVGWSEGPATGTDLFFVASEP